MSETATQLTRAARQLIEIEELFGGELMPLSRSPLPEIQPAAQQQQADLPPMTVEEKTRAMADLAQQVAACQQCLLSQSRHNTVPGEGNPNADLVFVGEAPGHDEDISGKPFVGRAGQLLTKMIAAMGLTRNDIFICNILKCRPPNNRPPMPDEITVCWDYLVRQLQIIQPKVIVTLGNPATKNLLNTSTGITRMRGQWQQLPDLGAGLANIPVMPTFHPSYVLRRYNADTRGKVWSDLQQVMHHLGLKVAEKQNDERQ